MARSFTELESGVIAKGKVEREDILNLVRLIPDSSHTVLLDTIKDWLMRLESNHSLTDVDAEWLERIVTDLENHGRIQPETLIGAEPRPGFDKFRKADSLNVTE